MKIERLTPAGVMAPIGPYCHITRAGPFISISGTAGVDPTTGSLVGPDVYSQACQILKSFKTMLEAVDCGFENVTNVNVFLRNIDDFDEMNRAYREAFGSEVPARTVIGVSGLPKKDALVTMNLSAIATSMELSPRDAATDRADSITR
jgi:2-iminobutanoate/2-iminopropanoate deaminase